MEQSVRERLLQARASLQKQHEVTLEIPGFERQLFARYRPMDYRESRRIGQRHDQVRDEVERELRVAADALVAACIACEADIDGEKHPLPRLGKELTDSIGLDGATNDREAVFLLFPSETAVIRQFVEIQEAEGTTNGKIDTELEGESLAEAS